MPCDTCALKGNCPDEEYNKRFGCDDYMEASDDDEPDFHDFDIVEYL